MFDPTQVIAEIAREPQNADQVIERLKLTDGNLRTLSDRLGIPSRSRAAREDLLAGLSAYFDSQQPMDAPEQEAAPDERPEEKPASKPATPTATRATPPTKAAGTKATATTKASPAKTATPAKSAGAKATAPSKPAGTRATPPTKATPAKSAATAKATVAKTADTKATGTTEATGTKPAAPANTAKVDTLTPPTGGDYLLLAPGVGATKSILFRVDTVTVKADGTVNITGKQFLIKHRTLSLRRREIVLIRHDDFQVVITAGQDVDAEALVIAARPERFGPGGTEVRKGSGPKADATTSGTTLAGKSYILARYGTTVAVTIDGQRREQPHGDEQQARRGYVNLLGTLESDLAVV